MRIGFDVDGVLADFSTAYLNLTVRTIGKDLFQPGDAEDAPCWNWDLYRGYTKEEAGQVWDKIKSDPHFWRQLSTLPGAEILRMCIYDLQQRHEIYFITNRIGVQVKQQTEHWLEMRLGLDVPTVLISAEKGMCAAALKLDAYIDDNYMNILDVARSSPTTRAYLLNRRYNTVPNPEMPEVVTPALPAHVTRVRSVGQMLDYENLAGNL